MKERLSKRNLVWAVVFACLLMCILGSVPAFAKEVPPSTSASLIHAGPDLGVSNCPSHIDLYRNGNPEICYGGSNGYLGINVSGVYSVSANVTMWLRYYNNSGGHFCSLSAGDAKIFGSVLVTQLDAGTKNGYPNC